MSENTRVINISFDVITRTAVFAQLEVSEDTDVENAIIEYVHQVGINEAPNAQNHKELKKHDGIIVNSWEQTKRGTSHIEEFQSTNVIEDLTPRDPTGELN